MPLSVLSLFWVRTESNSLRQDAKEDRKDIVNLMFAIKEDIKAIQMEMRDFHDRLCTIEENRGKAWTGSKNT